MTRLLAIWRFFTVPRTLIALALLLMLDVFLFGPVWAQAVPPVRPVCGPVAAMLEALGKNWGEIAESIFTSKNGLVLTLTVNRKTGTWTLLGQANASMCMLNVGEGFDDASEAIKALGVPGADT